MHYLLCIPPLLTIYCIAIRYIRLRSLKRHIKALKDVPLVKRDVEWAHRGLSYVYTKDFPFLSTISLEFALFRTYAVKYNTLLVSTGELGKDDAIRPLANWQLIHIFSPPLRSKI